MKAFKRSIILLILIFTAVLNLVGCTDTSQNAANTQSYKNNDIMKVHYIDVGQGDSILVQVNGKNLLIDAGTNESKNRLISYLYKQNIKKLDYVVATHPHEDHIGGMDAVIKKFNIGEFYAPYVTTSTKTFRNMINALKSKGLKINTAQEGVTLNLGENTTCEMLAPNSSKYKDLNNYSAVIKITYGSSKFLFMGDAQKISESEILDNNLDVSCDVLKVGHHGSSSSSSPEFLNKANPATAVISCGKNNDYGHPHKETLKKLNQRHIQIFRTDIDGNIIITSDGQNIKKIN